MRDIIHLRLAVIIVIIAVFLHPYIALGQSKNALADALAMANQVQANQAAERSKQVEIDQVDAQIRQVQTNQDDLNLRIDKHNANKPPTWYTDQPEPQIDIDYNNEKAKLDDEIISLKKSLSDLSQNKRRLISDDNEMKDNIESSKEKLRGKVMQLKAPNCVQILNNEPLDVNALSNCLNQYWDNSGEHNSPDKPTPKGTSITSNDQSGVNGQTTQEQQQKKITEANNQINATSKKNLLDQTSVPSPSLDKQTYESTITGQVKSYLHDIFNK